MANNFVNKFKNNISAEETLPTEIYYNATKKAICIELDAANKSSAGVTVGVAVEDTGSLGSAITLNGSGEGITSAANGTFTKSSHGLSVNDRIVFTIAANAAIASGSSDTNLNSSRYYFVQSVATNTFTIAESRSATVPIKFSSTGTMSATGMFDTSNQDTFAFDGAGDNIDFADNSLYDITDAISVFGWIYVTVSKSSPGNQYLLSNNLYNCS